MHYVTTLLAFITHHPGLAYGAVFLVSLSESLALVGLLVPGTTIMIGVGAIVATGTLKLTPVLILAMAGAIAGDGGSYWLGRHYKERLVEMWPFSRYPGMFKKGAAFFHRHGGKSILFGRFVGPVRPVIPVVAGMLGMRPVRFVVVNVLSGIGWALVYTLLGIFFGASLAVAGTISIRLAVLILILAAAVWSLIGLCRKSVSLFERKGPAALSALKQWATSETRPSRVSDAACQEISFVPDYSAKGRRTAVRIFGWGVFRCGMGLFECLAGCTGKRSAGACGPGSVPLPPIAADPLDG